MTMNGALHPRADVDRLYIQGDEGGRGMMSVGLTNAVCCTLLN